MPSSPLSARAFFRNPARYAASHGVASAPLQLRAPPAQRFVVVRRPDAIWSVLTRDGALLRQGKWKQRANRYVHGALNTLDGAEHRTRRLVVQPALDRRRIARFAGLVTRRVEEAEHAWAEGSVDLRARLDPLSVRITSEVLLSHDARDRAPALADALREVMTALPRLTPPTPGTRRAAALGRARAFADEAIDAHPSTDADLIDALLDAGLPRDVIRNEVIAFLLAACDEPPSALAAVWYQLAQKPDIEERLLDELTSSPEAVDDLPFLDAVVRESLRLHPPARHIDRCPVARTSVDGVDVEAGATVLVSPAMTHRDPMYWRDADTFDPARWLGETRPERGAYVPFGAGAHTCIGEPLALSIVKRSLAIVVPRRRVRLVVGADVVIPGAAPLFVTMARR